MHKFLFIIFFLPFLLKAQTGETAPISFATPYYEAVDTWVLFPANDDKNTYSLGFLYIDREAGFTLDYETEVTLENGKLINPTPDKQKEHFIKARLDRNTANVHILTVQQLKDLNLSTPKWLAVYKENSDSAGYKIDMAYFYNGAGASAIALAILQPLYANNKTNEKLLFELPYAYNALGKYPEALEVLDVSLQVNDTEELYYKEKLFANAKMFALEDAKTGYDTYLKKASTTHYRSEIVYNFVHSYYMLKDKKGFKQWSKELRSLEKKEHVFIQNLDLMEELWEEPRG